MSVSVRLRLELLTADSLEDKSKLVISDLENNRIKLHDSLIQQIHFLWMVNR